MDKFVSWTLSQAFFYARKNDISFLLSILPKLCTQASPSMSGSDKLLKSCCVADSTVAKDKSERQ